MQLLDLAKKKLSAPTALFLKLPLFKKVLIIGLIILLGWFASTRLLGQRDRQVQYQTAKVERGKLVVSVSESGQVQVANQLNVTTQATGVVAQVYVSNGEYVTAGQNIATINLDQAGQQREASARASYLSAKNTLLSANASSFTLQADMFDKWDTFKKLAESGDFDTNDERALPQFHIAEKEWLAAEAKFKNQGAVISQAQAQITSAWLSYQAAAATITAPIEGKISNLVIVPGITIENQNELGSSSQTVVSIESGGTPVITVNLSEIDVLKVKEKDKAKVTFDALPNKEFEGKVAGINRTGIVSSGVTTYPGTIVMDKKSNEILPNMSATVEIITETRDNVLLIPSAAIGTQNGRSFVRVRSRGAVRVVPVVTGASSETKVEIVSGLSEGDEIIVGTARDEQGESTSPFRLAPFGGGGAGRETGSLRHGGFSR